MFCFPQDTRYLQVTISKFHLWNVKFGSCRRLWTFLKKIYHFRKVQVGSEGQEEEGEAEQQGDGSSNSLEALAAKLKALQRSKHTLDLVCDIFSDFRVRKLGFMRLSRYQVKTCIHWLFVMYLG